MNNKSVAIFENKQVRRYYDEAKETWYFSVVDIVEALSGSANPTDYLKKLRKRDPELGSYIGTNCPQVEMLTNGKNRKTLAGNVQHIFRIIQSIPSPNAELSTRQIAEAENAKGLPQNVKASKKGGAVAKNARLELEAKTGKPVVTGENFLPPAKQRKQIKSK